LFSGSTLQLDCPQGGEGEHASVAVQPKSAIQSIFTTTSVAESGRLGKSWSFGKPLWRPVNGPMMISSEIALEPPSAQSNAKAISAKVW